MWKRLKGSSATRRSNSAARACPPSDWLPTTMIRRPTLLRLCTTGASHPGSSLSNASSSLRDRTMSARVQMPTITPSSITGI